MKTLITFLVVVTVALTPLARLYAQTGSEEYLRVRIFLYSGVPDPEFKITDPKVIAKLLSDAAALPANPAITSQTADICPPVLGYRGFAIENHTTQHREIAVVKVFGSKVEIWRAKDGSGASAPKVLVKDFRLDDAPAPTETLLLHYTESSGLSNPRLQASVSARLATLKQ